MRCECLCHWKLMHLHVEGSGRSEPKRIQHAGANGKPLERELGEQVPVSFTRAFVWIKCHCVCSMSSYSHRMLNLSLPWSLFSLWRWAYQQHCATTSPGEELLTGKHTFGHYVGCWTQMLSFHPPECLRLGIINTRHKGDIQGSETFKNLSKVMQKFRIDKELDSNRYCGLQYQGQEVEICFSNFPRGKKNMNTWSRFTFSGFLF